MIEQDYVMRIIKEMIRFLLNIVYNIDTESPTAEILKDQELKNVLEELIDMVDAGKINEAENKLYSIVELNSIIDGANKNYLKIALLFYSYLNDNIYLVDNGFNRENIKMGIEDIASKYGIGGVAEIFLN